MLAAPHTPRFADEVDGSLKSLLRRYEVPAASVAVVRDSKVAWTTHGDDVFEVASLSKTATSLAVLSLVEQEKVSLDEPVNTYLHRWRVKSTRFDVSKVTVRRLLDHTSGLPVGKPVERPLAPYPGIEAVLDGETGQPVASPVVEPGTKFQYSNPGYGVLELLIEEVTHESYPDAMRRLIFEPLGMHDTGYQNDEALLRRVVSGSERAGHHVGPFLRAPRAAGGMLTTAHDAALLLTAVLLPRDRGGLLERSTLDEMRTLEPEARGAFGLGKENGYALGIATGTLASGEVFVGNNGSHSGYNALLLGIPAKETGFVVLTNSDTGIGVELELVTKFLKDAGEKLPIVSRFSQIRTVVRGATYLLLAMLLFFTCRFLLRRRWIRGSTTWRIARGSLIALSGIAFGVVFDTALLTGPIGGIPPARFISAEYETLAGLVALASVVSGVRIALTKRR